MKLTGLILFLALGNFPANAEDLGASVAPATTEDLEAFDRALAKASESGITHSQFGQEIANQAKELREEFGREQVAKQAAQAKKAGRQDNTRSLRETISGKRAGKQDNPGRGDSGKPAKGHKK